MKKRLLLSASVILLAWTAVAGNTYLCDTITRAITGSTGATTYVGWTYTGKHSGASYTGNSAGAVDCRINKGRTPASGIIASIPKGNLRKIYLKWAVVTPNLGTNRQFTVYGKQTAYPKIDSVYLAATRGVELGAMVSSNAKAGTWDSLVFLDNYANIGCASTGTALVAFDQIIFVWDTAKAIDPVVDHIDFGKTAMNFQFEGHIIESLNATVVMNPSGAKAPDITYNILDPSVASLSLGTYVVAKSVGSTYLTATAGDVTDSLPITVSAAQAIAGTRYVFTDTCWSTSQNAWTYTAGKGGYKYVNGPVDNFTKTASIGVQVSTSRTGAGAQTISSVSNVKKVTFIYGTNANNGAGSIDLSIAGKSVGSQNITAATDGTGNDHRALSFTLDTAKTGVVKFTVNCTTNSIYIYAVYIETESTISVTGVTLDSAALHLVEGSDYTLTATIAPTDATDKSVTWSSDDEDVATVADGKVTAVAAGTATITVTTTDGSKTATCAVTVTAPVVHVTGVTLDSAALHLVEGADYTLTATIAPTDATDKSVTWSSDDEDVATVADGKVTAVAAGTATITVTTTDGSKTATCAVTVTAPVVHVTGVTLDSVALHLVEGADYTLTATVAPTDATDKSVTWSSDDEDVATVADGKVTAVAAGTATITVTTTDGSKTATCAVTVTAPVVHVTGVTLDSAALHLVEGSDYTLTATIAPTDATDKSVTWSSDDASVATVADGKVTAIAAGTATITVTTTDGSKTATCAVTVTAPVVHVTGVTLDSAALHLVEGADYTLTATVAPTDATDKSVTWSSDDASVATVTDGKVTAVAAGTATITVTTADGSKTATCAVTVTKLPVPVTGVTLTEHAVSIYTNDSATLTATIAPANADNQSVVWTSRNTSIATVTNGKVRALAVGEVYVVAASAENAAMNDSCKITITDKPINYPTVGTTFVVDGIKYRSLGQDSVQVVANNPAYSGAIAIPSTVMNESIIFRVVGIASQAFKESTVSSVFVPKSVLSIGDSIFDQCTYLTSLTVDAANPKYDSRNGNKTIVETKSNRLLYGCAISTIDPTITSINARAFFGRTGFDTLTIGTQVLLIGSHAFDQCDIKVLNVSSATIEMYAFANCVSLKSIIFGAEGIQVKGNSFAKCSNVKDMTMQTSTPPTYEGTSFSEVSDIIPIYIPCGSLNAYKLGYWNFLGTLTELTEWDLTVTSEDLNKGTADTTRVNCGVFTLTATAKTGYQFKQWSDYDKTNPRTLTLSKNTTLTAQWEKAPVKVTGIALANPTHSMQASTTFKLQYTITPDTAANKAVTWGTTNASIATVDTGLITAVAEGSVKIWVKTLDGDFTDTCFLTVTPAVIPVEGVNIKENNFSILVGKDTTLSATLSPAGAVGKITWAAIPAAGIITLNDTTGKIEAVAAGSVQVAASCEGFVSDPITITVLPIPVDSLVMNVHSAAMKTEDTLQLSATIYPSNAGNKAFKWMSADASLATVSNDGQVIALAVGQVAVYAISLADSTKKDSCLISIADRITHVTSVAIAENSMVLPVGTDSALSLTVLPTDATNPAVLWKSTVPSVASVANGVVTALTAGETFVVATSVDDSTKTDTCRVTVVVPVTGVTLNIHADTINRYAWHSLSAQVAPTNATNKNLTWKSLNTTIATVATNGTVTAQAKGRAAVVVTTQDGGFTDTCYILVRVPVESVTMMPDSVLTSPTLTKQITATVLPIDADNKKVTYYALDPAIATVDSTGLITGVTQGTTMVIATSVDGELKDTCFVTVDDQVHVERIYFNIANPTCEVEGTLDLSKRVVFTPTNTSDKSLAWSVSNDNATISPEGVLTGVSRGTVIVTAITNDGNKMANIEVTITMKTYHVDSIAFYQSSTTVFVGENKNIKYSVQFFPANVTNPALNWISLSPDIVTVNNGILTGIKPGEAYIMVTSKDGSKKATLKVIVIDPVVHVTAINIVPVGLKNDTLILTEGDVENNMAQYVSVLPANADNKAVRWSSLNPSVANVDNGVLTANKAGVATLIATTVDGNLEARMYVRVLPKIYPVEQVVALVADTQVVLFDKVDLRPLVLVLPEVATNKSLLWTSSDQAVAIVSNGLVTTKKEGQVIITAVSLSDGSKSAEIVVTVVDTIIHVESLEFMVPGGAMEVEFGKRVELSTYLQINPVEAQNKVIKWSSSDDKVVYIDNNGKILARRIGTAVVTAKSADTGVEATLTIRVVEHTALDNVLTSASVSLSDTRLVVQSQEKMAIQLYSVQGQLVDNAEVYAYYERELQKGIYILQVNGERQKLIVR